MIVCYAQACSVVVELWRSGVYVGRIARRAGLGHGYIYGMLRGCGGEPQITLVTPDGAPSHGLKADAPAFWLGPLVVLFEPWSPKALQ